MKWLLFKLAFLSLHPKTLEIPLPKPTQPRIVSNLGYHSFSGSKPPVIALNQVSVKDISCMFAEVDVSINEKNRFEARVRVVYLEVRDL